MYQLIDEEFVDNQASTSFQPSEQTLSLATNQEREVFTTSILSKFLNDKKLKELETITDRIKYKRHLIEMSTKEIKKEKSIKRSTNVDKTKKLTKKKRKELGVCRLDKNESLNYGEYEKLNEAWLGYATSCLLTCIPKTVGGEFELNEETVLSCLKQMDYHGCKVKITKSTTKSVIGLTGIILQDKRNVFYLLSPDNKIKIVPKAGNLFEIEILGSKFTLVGSNMVFKPEMRVTKHAKIKTKVDIR